MPVTFNDLLGDNKTDFECPNCGRSFKVKLKDVFKDGTVLRCPHCSAEIALKRKPDIPKAINDINRSLKNIQKTFKKMSR